MHRLIYSRKLFYQNIHLTTNSSMSCFSVNTRLPAYFCSYCKNTLNSHLKTVYAENVRYQSTKAATLKSVRRKLKLRNFKKYVELLEVKGKEMKETKASVSKLKPIHMSRLTSNPEVSLEQLHKLTLSKNSTKKIKNEKQVLEVDPKILQDIENAIMKNYGVSDYDNVLQKDNFAIIFASEFKSDINNLFRDKNKIEIIRKSYQDFINETTNKMNVEYSMHQDIDTVSSPNDLGVIMDSDINIESDINNDLDLSLRDSSIFPYLDNSETMDDFFENTESCKREADVSKVKNGKKRKSKHFSTEKEHINEEALLKAKEASLSKLLHVHLEICVAVGLIDKAYKILMHYRNRGKRTPQCPIIRDISLYNVLLLGYAKTGSYNQVRDLLNVLKEDQIGLNIKSYAAIFQCIELSNLENKGLKLKEHFTFMKSKGFSLDDMFNECSYIGNQRQTIINAIRRLEPNYAPKYREPDLNYNCMLVNNLNPSNISQKKGVYNESDMLTSPAKGIITMEELLAQMQKQVDNEVKGIVEIRNLEVKDNPTKNVLYFREKLKKQEKEWRTSIHKALTRKLHSLKSYSNASHNVFNIYPYLLTLEIDDYIELLMLEIRKLADGSETYSPTVRTLQRDIGTKVFYRYQIKKMKDDGTMTKIIDLYKKYCQWYLNENIDMHSSEINSRRMWQKLVHEHRDGSSLDHTVLIWPYNVCSSIGTFLYDIIVNDVKIDINIMKKNSTKVKNLPILYNILRGKEKILRKEVKPHPLLPRLVRESQSLTLFMDAISVPSLCPPLPWSDFANGGYLLTKTALMRSQYIERLKEAEPKNLYPVLDSLNQLGCIPWTINKPVLDILIQVFQSGGSRPLNVPIRANYLPQLPPLSASLSKAERNNLMKQRAINAKLRQEMYSLWCDALYKLSLANVFRDKIFWLPHNMDFRGRVYPYPPHLSHLGADTSRAVMIFACGKPLGPKGLTWLKLHCINLTGTMKKNTINERLAHVETLMDEILDSADNPLKGRHWWAKSEEPWQTLACCMEIAKAMRCRNPEEYICHFPVHQDGSCNGLQHYAALGGDSAGAFSVNLSHAERPQDVYSAVVNLVEANRLKDANDNVEIAQMLDGFITRKVIKQTVMTTVYGVTKYGAKLQIAKQLKDMDDFPKEHIWLAAPYLSNKVFESLQEMFTSTKEIQDWFTDCAKMIAGICETRMEWTTPLGLPVVQPYMKTSKCPTIKKGDLLEYASVQEFYGKPCIRKQKNAFPPNFIHSLDSSHMMLTSLHCELSNVTYVSVHDCFWTHPSTVEMMNKICREQFVALHSQPILENLAEDMSKRYSFNESDIGNTGSVLEASKRRLNILLKKIPPKGDFDLKNVLNSIYFFS